MSHWTVEIFEDAETGELTVPFPADLLETMGWKEGDEISWEIEGNIAIIKKVEK